MRSSSRRPSTGPRRRATAGALPPRSFSARIGLDRHEEGPRHRGGVALRTRGPVAARCHGRGNCRRERGRPDRRPHSAAHTDRTAERNRVGMDCRSNLVFLDHGEGAASGLRAARHRAHHPHDRARPAALGRRGGRRDPARTSGCLRRCRRLVETARGVAARNHHRVSAQSHAADPQGSDRARHKRQGHNTKRGREPDRSAGQRGGWQFAYGSNRVQRRDHDDLRERTMLNLNRATLSLDPINSALNAEIERVAMATAEQPRPYLGASIVGFECGRRTQYSWWIKADLTARTREIFQRGHFFERRVRDHLKAIGFKFAADEACAFTAVGGALRGHADGILIAGTATYLVYPAIWENKALGAKGWRALERDGLEKVYPQYAAQVALYQAYLDVTNPALFSAVNADTCEVLFFLVPFDAELAQFWSDRAANIIAATRANELLPRAFDS